MKLKFQDEIVKTIKLKQQNHSIECSLKVHLILLHNFAIWICLCLRVMVGALIPNFCLVFADINRTFF